MLLASLSFLALLLPAYASGVTVVNDLDSQLPAVARVGQAYSWAISPSTFKSSNGDLKYTAQSLPEWLSFDPSTLAFSGTPSADDEGNKHVSLTAEDSSGSSASSDFTVCVTHYPAPVVNIPITDQFHADNPSLSSVFVLSPDSAIATDNPTLRIPSKWSFSIGFEGETFAGAGDINYQTMQADGSPLPDWMIFRPKQVTLDGYVPDEHSLPTPSTFNLALHVADKDGYSAAKIHFDVVIASHELSLSTASLPTINITAGTHFNVSLASPADFMGVLVDGQPIQPDNISSLSIDTSHAGNWVKYDAGSRMLSGDPGSDLQPGKGPLLPVTLKTTFNQSISTNVSVAIVPSYFSTTVLPPIQAKEGDEVHFSVAPFFSNKTSGEQRSDVTLSASYEPIPPQKGDFFAFNPDTGELSGRIPSDYTSSSHSDHIDVTYTAYSRVTHSTSHASLRIAVAAVDSKKKSYNSPGGGLSPRGRKKLVLALGITFGILGSIAAFCGLLAACRRCSRVEDTALGTAESAGAYSDREKAWYGMEEGQSLDEEAGYGWSHQMPKEPREAMDLGQPSGSSPMTPDRSNGKYAGLGIGLQATPSKTPSISTIQSPGVIPKHQFVAKIKQTVRQVSDRYKRSRGASGNQRPAISKPTLVTTTKQLDGLPLHEDPFGAINPRHTMISITNSPSSSTGEHSIPRRRPDFGPPQKPALAHLRRGEGRPLSTVSSASMSTSESAKTHAAEATIHTASRAVSIRSAHSVSGVSYTEPARPRLVPFTSSSRVPVPRVPSSRTITEPSSKPNGPRRVPSQTAKVVPGEGSPDSNDMDKSATEADLALGITYVNALGADQKAVAATGPSSLTVSTNVRSSFSSLESHGSTSEGSNVTRMVVRTGERFNFRVPALLKDGVAAGGPRALQAKLLDGQPLPKFMHVDVTGGKQKGTVMFFGVPVAKDVGAYDVGVYAAADGACVTRVLVEVVSRR